MSLDEYHNNIFFVGKCCVLVESVLNESCRSSWNVELYIRVLSSLYFCICRNNKKSLCSPKIPYTPINAQWHIFIFLQTKHTHLPKRKFSTDMGCLCFDVPPRVYFFSDILKVNP